MCQTDVAVKTLLQPDIPPSKEAFEALPEDIKITPLYILKRRAGTLQSFINLPQEILTTTTLYGLTRNHKLTIQLTRDKSRAGAISRPALFLVASSSLLTRLSSVEICYDRNE